MPTAAAPEKAIAVNRKLRVVGGLNYINAMLVYINFVLTHKFMAKLSVPQSSLTIENMARIGILRRLL